jgi:hypothetical protein
MQEGEVGGIWPSNLIKLFEENGFTLIKQKKFALNLNNLFIFTKNS